MRKRTGTIDPINGRFRVRVTSPATGRREVIGTFDTEAEATTYRDRALAIIEREAPLSGGITVLEFGKGWLDAREINREIAAVKKYRSVWKTHVAGDAIAKMAVKHVRRVHILEWVGRVKKGRARGTVLKALSLLSRLFQHALDRELVKSNPCASIELPRERRTHNPWTHLIPEEQAKLIDAGNDEQRCLIAFAIGTGLRAGELVSLRLADLHVDVPEPHAVIRYGSKDDATKSGKIRHVPLFGWALEAARTWLRLLPTFAKKNPKKIVFPGKHGGFRSAEHPLRWNVWTSLLAKAGIKRRFRWHDLRHTCASSLVSGWWGRVWTLQEVKEMLGHSSITVTERYAHLAETALKLAAKQMPNAIGAANDSKKALPQSVQFWSSAPSLPIADPAEFTGGAPGPTRTGDQRFRNPPRTSKRAGTSDASDQLVPNGREAHAIGLASVRLEVDGDVVAEVRAFAGDEPSDVAERLAASVARRAPVKVSHTGGGLHVTRRASGGAR